MSRALLATSAVLVLAIAWLGLARADTAWPFTTHMTMHMAVVAIAAPLLALALTGSRHDPAARMPALFLAVPLSLLELVAVWGWHAPALHHLARHTTGGLIAEQATFFVTGTWVWVAALGGGGSRTGAGLLALLLTSMHMTLLGALLALATRPLYAHGSLEDQHLGGAVMLLIGGATYLTGGLALAARLLRRHRLVAAQEPHGSGSAQVSTFGPRHDRFPRASTSAGLVDSRCRVAPPSGINPDEPGNR